MAICWIYFLNFISMMAPTRSVLSYTFLVIWLQLKFSVGSSLWSRVYDSELACFSAGMDLRELLDIPQGDRRKYHDDVTVMVVSLEGRIWKSSGKYIWKMRSSWWFGGNHLFESFKSCIKFPASGSEILRCWSIFISLIGVFGSCSKAYNW